MIKSVHKNKIELLFVDLLNQHWNLIEELKVLNYKLALSSGWHYLLDWSWVISHLNKDTEKTILDAGAGIGLLQWYLAERGATVISVDRSDRSCIPFHLIRRYNVTGFTGKDNPLNLSQVLGIKTKNVRLLTIFKSLIRGLIGTVRVNKYRSPGAVLCTDKL